MEWVFEDGTKVRLGGEVIGKDTPFVRRLRRRLEYARTHKISSGFGPTPDELILDVNVSYLLDSFLRDELLEVVSGPDVEYPKLEPRPDGFIY